MPRLCYPARSTGLLSQNVQPCSSSEYGLSLAGNKPCMAWLPLLLIKSSFYSQALVNHSYVQMEQNLFLVDSITCQQASGIG